VEQLMDRFIAEFLSQLNAEKKAANTVAAYALDLQQMADYLRETHQVVAPAQVTTDMLQAFLQSLQSANPPYALSTISRKTSAVNAFFRQMLAHNAAVPPAALRLRAPPVPRRAPQVLSRADIQRLMEVTTKTGRAKGTRDWALLALLCATGVRVSELITLLVNDVDWEANELVCGEAGAARRRLPLGAARDALVAYLQQGRPALAHAESPNVLFLNHRGDRITRQGVWLLLRAVAQEAGLKKITPQILRHTYAYQLLTKGEDLREVQARLGHANLITTQIYRQVEPTSAPP
jgi:integrase/recombinase XerD